MKDLFFILQDELSKLPIIEGATYAAGAKLVSAPHGGYFVFHVSARKDGEPERLLTYKIFADEAFQDVERHPHANHLRHLVTCMTEDIRNKWGVR